MNIFIAKSEWVNKYCEWLFSILFEVEKNISISDDNYQKRVFGFLSRRAKFKSNIDKAPEYLAQIEELLETVFMDFFPDMIDAVKNESWKLQNLRGHVDG